MSTKLILADDHRIVRQGLKALLEKDGKFDVVAEASNGTEAVRLAMLFSPDVIVMDLRMPDLGGIDATRQILMQRPQTKVIGLSGFSHVAMGTEMLRAGAAGYVFKDAAVDELVTAISTVMAGNLYVSPAISRQIVADRIDRDASPGGRPPLSPREQEVLRLVADGRSTKQAARDLSVSVKTIETHRRNLMEKLKIDNVADLTKYAIRSGLCEL